jgi:hypothetical protein
MQQQQQPQQQQQQQAGNNYFISQLFNLTSNNSNRNAGWFVSLFQDLKERERRVINEKAN